MKIYRDMKLYNNNNKKKVILIEMTKKFILKEIKFKLRAESPVGLGWVGVIRERKLFLVMEK